MKLIEKEHLLQATVYGELNPTTDLAIDAAIRRECEERAMDLVLIDIRPMSSRLYGIENHVAAKTFRERMGPGIRAIAIVDTVDFKERSELYELTASNRWANVRFFEEIEAAENWLLALSR